MSLSQGILKINTPWQWKKNRAVKGHLPQKVSRVCTLFLKKGGRIHCRVNGQQRYLIGYVKEVLELQYSGVIFMDLIFMLYFHG